MHPLLKRLHGRFGAVLAMSSAVLAMLSFFALVATAAADSSIPTFGSTDATAASAPSCRYGAAVLGANQASWLEKLNAGWYVNFGHQGYGDAPASEFAPVIRVQQVRNGCTRLPDYTVDPPLTDAGLGASIRSHPGSLWIVGNEPDRGPNPEDTTCAHRVQDDTAPDVYARAYYDVYSYIKRVDPSAKVANGALVEITPGRLQYLDIVWNTYRTVYGVDMPVDVWNMHLYILPEALPSGQPNGIANVAIGTDPKLAIRESGGQAANCSRPDVYCWAEHDDMAAFTGQVVAMRQWMKDHGQREKQLIISEYSLLYFYTYPDDPASCFQDEYGNCFTPARVTNFLNKSIDYLETAQSPELGYSRDSNKLVQRWLWYSISTQGAGDVSNLTDGSMTKPSLVGNAYFGRAAASLRSVNLLPAAYSAQVTGGAGGAAGSALLTVDVRNQGTVAAGQSFAVNFYRNAARTDLIGSVNVPAGLFGCDARGAPVQMTWPGLSPGWHSFWVEVDAGNAIAEVQEGDNVIQGSVFVGRTQMWLPLSPRNAVAR